MYAVDVLTLFPELFGPFFGAGLLGKAAIAGVVDLRAHDLRGWATDRHRTADDTPYGGGAGMVMKVDVVVPAIEAIRANRPGQDLACIHLSASGHLFTQAMARELATRQGMILVCGRYEGIDARVDRYVDKAVAIGDYVLAGGEAAAMVLIESVCRLLPGVMGNEASAAEESHENVLLEYPQYTRPPEFRGDRVPEVLMTGHHAAIAAWRRNESERLTRERRPDLWHKFVEAKPS